MRQVPMLEAQGVIASVEPFVIPYLEPNDHGSTRFICLVKVTSRDGATGWGEGVTLFKEATFATAALIAGFADVLEGVPASPQAAARAIDERAWWYGDGGIASFARAAIDIALWDLVLTARGQTLIDALGGGHHERLPTVISCHAALADVEESAELLASWVGRESASGIKVGFGKRGDADLGRSHERDVSFVRHLRAALGNESLLMVDIGARIRWSLEEAISRTAAFEEHGLHWIEEPLGADDPAGYAALHASATTSLIAYGEREWSPRSIKRIVDSGTVDVVGIDPGRAEGITGFAQALVSIEAAGRQANAHAFAGPITYAASLALSLTSAACHQLEVPPHRNEAYALVDSVPMPVDGWVVAIERPGLGVVLDEDAVRARSV